MLSPAPGVLIQDKYLLETPLARGGMGSVWTATHRELAVKVAVKFMAPEVAAAGAEGSARFEREARAAAHLESRHIVQIRDYGVTDGTPFLVMELLKGESLEQRLARVRRLSFTDALAILQQLGRGLRKAHEAGIIHRDLKPGNIFLAHADDEEVVKILDFGIAKFAHAAPDANATRTGMLMGSVHYASPEQLRSSKDADARSDIWSVGVILFRMLTGGLPFGGQEIGDIIVKVCAEPIPTARSRAPDLPPESDAFFLRALARNPAERFQSISELVDAFAALAQRSAAVTVSQTVDAETAPPAASTEPISSEGDLPPTLKFPEEEAEPKTALWSNAQRPPAPSLPEAQDNTLQASGTTSITANRAPGVRPSRSLLLPVTGATVLVLAAAGAGAALLRSGQVEGGEPLSPAATDTQVPADPPTAVPPAEPFATSSQPSSVAAPGEATSTVSADAPSAPSQSDSAAPTADLPSEANRTDPGATNTSVTHPSETGQSAPAAPAAPEKTALSSPVPPVSPSAAPAPPVTGAPVRKPSKPRDDDADLMP